VPSVNLKQTFSERLGRFGKLTSETSGEGLWRERRTRRLVKRRRHHGGRHGGVIAAGCRRLHGVGVLVLGEVELVDVE